MLKVAFLFAGQYRPICHQKFISGFRRLVRGIEHGIFSFAWDEPGLSMDHQANIPKLEDEICVKQHLNLLFADFNLIALQTESMLRYEGALPFHYHKIQTSHEHSIRTVHSLPQLYTLHRSYQLFLPHINEYDLVFRCRYDSIFLHPLNIYPLQEMVTNSNIVYNINFGRAYYPRRIYDIFFGGSCSSMNFIEELWQNLPKLINNQFDNGLEARDACRILYLGAVSTGKHVSTLDSRICDIYRHNDSQLYIKYIIFSHVFRPLKTFCSLPVLIHILRWSREEKIALNSLILFFLYSLMLSPIMYLKRFKYLKGYIQSKGYF